MEGEGEKGDSFSQRTEHCSVNSKDCWLKEACTAIEGKVLLFKRRLKCDVIQDLLFKRLLFWLGQWGYAWGFKG